LYEGERNVTKRALEIRRLALSEVLDEAFTLFRVGFVRFLLFQLILYVPSTIALALIFNAAGDMLIAMLRTGAIPTIEEIAWKASLAFGSFLLIQTAIASLSSVALSRGVADTYLGREWSVGSILKEAIRLTPRATATWVFIGLAVVVCLIVPIGALGGIGLVFGPKIYAAGGILVAAILGLLGAAIALMAAACAVYLILRYGLVPTVLAIEDTSIAASFRRGIQLMKGRYVPALGLLLVLTMLGALLGGVLSAFVPSPAFEGKDVDEIRRLLPQIIRSQILSAIFGQAMGVLTHTYSVICWTLFYFSTRCEKEGFDLAFLASRAAEDQVVPSPQTSV
jgi:hypothetical protein